MMSSQFFLVLVWMFCAPVVRAETPPLGKRAYLLGSEGSVSSIQRFQEGSRSSHQLMRDPILSPTAKEQVTKPRPEKKAREIESQPKARLTFAKKIIAGRYAKPRIDFILNPLPLSRADEVVRFDPIENIYQSNQTVEGDSN